MKRFDVTIRPINSEEIIIETFKTFEDAHNCKIAMHKYSAAICTLLKDLGFKAFEDKTIEECLKPTIPIMIREYRISWHEKLAVYIIEKLEKAYNLKV